MDTATATVSKTDQATAKQDDIKKLAQMIATACITKLKLESKYFTSIRWYGAPCPMPFIEIGVTPNGKPVETHEFSVCLPAMHYLCETKEERSDLANYIFKQIQLGVGKWEAK